MEVILLFLIVEVNENKSGDICIVTSWEILDVILLLLIVQGKENNSGDICILLRRDDDTFFEEERIVMGDSTVEF
jgi:hypothetical protein